MFWFDLLLAFLLAWVFVLLLAGPLGWRHPRRPDSPVAETIIFLFLIFFLAIWAGGIWMAPVGPVIAGYTWLPFVLVGLFVLLLIAAASAPREPPRTTAEARVEAEEAAAVGTALGAFFWILLTALIVAIIVSYFV